MSRSVSIFLSFLITSSVVAQPSFSFGQGASHRDSAEFKQIDKFKIWDFEDWAANTNVSGFSSIISYVENVQGGEKVLVLSRDLHVAIIDSEMHEFTRTWSLTRWSKELIAPQVQSMYNPNYDWVSEDGWDRYTDETYRLDYHDSKPALGCYGQHTLRYGDLEEDGNNELLLFLGSFEYKQDMVVFSPDHERIVFSMRYALQDALEFDSSEWQYIQRTRQRDGNAGTRVYAKAFLGDFDADANPDILVWRKRFESLKPSDPRNGFERTEQIWQHFERDLEAQVSSDKA